jgi:hypothetical protein
MPTDAVEALLRLAREMLRPEALRSFEAAWEWAAPRARTEEEHRLMAATLVLLNGCQALLAPRRLPPGAQASLQVTGTRSTPSSPLRRHVFVTITPDGTPLPGSEPDSLCFSGTDVHTSPFRCAAQILGELLTRLAE